MITGKHLARRTFLRGIGTAISLPVLDAMMKSGLVTLEKVQVLQYGTEGLMERSGSA